MLLHKGIASTSLFLCAKNLSVQRRHGSHDAPIAYRLHRTIGQPSQPFLRSTTSFFSTSASSMADPLSSILKALKTEQIIPDVIPESKFTPGVLFSVTYPSGKEAVLGAELTKEETADEPDIVITPLNITAPAGQTTVDTSYTLVMTDPDAPSRAEPKYRQFRHWVITGLKAPASTSSETKNIVALKPKASTTPYQPPGPPPGSGFHRYVFFLFEEPSTGTEFTIPSDAPEHGAALEQRRNWDAFKFGEKYGLKVVGASYFLVRSKDE